MKQEFDINMAETYGVPEAIVFEIIKKTIFERCYPVNWKSVVQIPTHEFCDEMPYVKRKTIERAVSHLKSEGVIAVSRTWCNNYSITDKGFSWLT